MIEDTLIEAVQELSLEVHRLTAQAAGLRDHQRGTLSIVRSELLDELLEQVERLSWEVRDRRLRHFS